MRTTSRWLLAAPVPLGRTGGYLSSLRSPYPARCWRWGCGAGPPAARAVALQPAAVAEAPPGGRRSPEAIAAMVVVGEKEATAGWQ
jgi:hypothetical protein